LLVVTDGDPADVDVYDDKYLVEDARFAVDSARRRDIRVFACCLPGGDGRAQRRIFGRQQAPLERLQDLPARLHAACSARGEKAGPTQREAFESLIKPEGAPWTR
jgi:nitric oxide reductase activation protein